MSCIAEQLSGLSELVEASNQEIRSKQKRLSFEVHDDLLS